MTSAPDPQNAGPVHVIVLNWNKEEDTAACVDSLLLQRDIEIHVLIVDNASPDGSGARLHARYPALAFLQSGENLGYAGGNNLGLEWARARNAEWVMVVNNDTVIDPECVRRLLDVAIAEPSLAAVAPLIVRFDDQDTVWSAGGRHDRVRAIGVHGHFARSAQEVLEGWVDAPSKWHDCTFLSGCCLLFRRSALDEVGPFRADYFAYVEDLEMSMRLSSAGWRMGWVPAARLAHRVPPLGVSPSPMQIWLRDRNRRRLVRDGYAPLWKFLFALWFWPTRLIHLARYALRGDWQRASAIVAGMTAR